MTIAGVEYEAPEPTGTADAAGAPLRPALSILIVSIGRPELVRTIVTARAAAIATGLTYEIVVVDDSIDARTLPLLVQCGTNPDDIVHVNSSSRNIARARNTSLAHARGRFLAFIDDDEWAEPDWLTRHMAVLEEFAADAVIGPVRAHYPHGAPGWIVRGDPYSRWWLPRGKRLVRGTTANALVRQDMLTRHALHFAESYGRSGGEDADLFQRLSRAGGIIVAGDGVVHEDVAMVRCNATDLRLRALRVGQTFARSIGSDRSGLGRVVGIASASAKCLVLGGYAIALLPIGMKYALPKALKAARNGGKIRELMGLDLVEYYRPSD